VRTLFICEPGCRIVVRRGVVTVLRREGRPIELSPALYDQVVIATSRASVTSKALRLMAAHGIDLVVLDARGDPVGRLYPLVINRTVEARRAQYEAMVSGRGLQAAKRIVEAKIRNQAAVLKYFAKARGRPELREEAYGLEVAADRVREMPSPTPEKLMEEEAWAARRYWQLVATLLPEDYGFHGRDQSSPDPFNMMLNYGYGILYYVVERALLLVGLDPYGGFMHRERSGKRTLVFDFIEQFRPVAVDKPLVAAAHRIKPDLFNGLLSYDTRKRVAAEVLENLSRPHAYRGRRVPLEQIVVLEARELARFLRGVEPEYRGYHAWW